MPQTPIYGLPYENRNDPPGKTTRAEAGPLLADAVEDELQRIDADRLNGYRFLERVYFTSSGNFVKGSYSGLRAIFVQAVGGGGGGGGNAATGVGQVAESAGGGGGGYAAKWILETALAASETVTIGAGGAGGTAGANPGSAGGNTSFGAFITGNGGNGGSGGTATSTTAAANVGGGGGTAGTPDLAITGSSGGAGVVISGVPVRQNRGGSSWLSTEVGNTAASSAGNTGRSYGGGATGVRSSASEAAKAGPDGGPGIVIIDIYV